jgi:hypothetical protein
LGINVGDIAAGQYLGSKISISLPIFAKEDKNSISALAQIHGKSGLIKYSEAGFPSLQSCTFRRA